MRRAQLKRVQPALAYAVAHLDEDVSLGTLASQAGLSIFQLHRIFSSAVGETPKQLTQRLRLERAAVLLLTRKQSVLEVALACGFQSPEVFLRAFHRQFGVTPGAYRRRGFANSATRRQIERHGGLVATVGPCVGLFHIDDVAAREANHMDYSIVRKEIAFQPVLCVRRRVRPGEVAAALAESLGHVFSLAQRNGLALAGEPFTRYIEWGPGLWTIDAGLPVATPVVGRFPADPGKIEVLGDTLPGGPVATTTHSGLYDGLRNAHAAVQLWIEERGLVASGAPWEVYTTDPADYPDPKDWKTDLFWPLAR
jgi:AraC family transcriptional regulator